MSEYLPEELLIKIFLTLPINFILVCTSVCKSWYAVITSPSFISAHLNHQNDHLLVRYCSVDPGIEFSNEWYDGRTTPVKEIYALYSDNENFEQYAQFLDVPFKVGCYLNIVGSCNGVLCLSDNIQRYNHLYYLWNPFIRKSVQLPRPIFTCNTHGPFDHTLGFGFDPLTNDYKVVRVVRTDNLEFEFDPLTNDYKVVHTDNRVPPHVELYKLSTGVWLDISHVAPAYRFLDVIPGLYVNGACHWVTMDPDMIVLFDVHDEIFLEMMLPESAVVYYFRGGCNLFVSKESLCLANSLFDRKKTIHIWRMKVYGDPESWVKVYSINSHITFNVSVVDELHSMFNGGLQRQVVHFLVKAIGSRRNGEIMWRTDNDVLVSYDTVAEKVKDLGIHSANFDSYHDALSVINSYKVSLILLDKR